MGLDCHLAFFNSSSNFDLNPRTAERGVSILTRILVDFKAIFSRKLMSP